MKYFSTGFYVDNTAQLKNIFDECFTWVQESPHTSFIPAQLFCDYKKEYNPFESGNEKIEILIHENKSNNITMCCFRYSKISTPHKWITDISVNKDLIQKKTWVQVESSVVSQEAAYSAPQPKKPLIVMRLIEKFPGGNDDFFPISIEPFRFKDDNDSIKFASDIINGNTKNKLPVIYVSSKYYFNEHPHNIIPERLARKVCGLAHVVVEPGSKIFSNKVKRATNAKNAYSGVVGIYWPKGQGISFYKRNEKSAKDFEDEIYEEVLKATTTMAPISNSGWSEIQNQKTKESINTLKEKGEHTQELIELYEEDNTAQKEKIDELNQKINHLENRIRILQAKAPSQGDISISIGDEIDFYENEIKGFIITSLKQSLLYKKTNCRSYHIITSIIENNQIKNEKETHSNALKRALTGYRNMDKRTLSQLKDLGFDAKEEGKHWKITYNEDSRYTYILPKSGSDHRGSLNAISDIDNLIFS
ncbi:hypothetical protein [Dickeya fangzhongdai]|uniref:Uncharacterized protein n=1 Tax=Dickeya fangzhongdai TaxID=1778540 RepID=A0A2K8QHT9_9GAMM|nr:hypothetical protein [Dickeya fangzhongdai]ATZ93031.1 hypothetical protein CVE23_02990 [Dickeya fangzhongdai]QOH46462.1 hypothetical protein DYD82_03025 [Dickeya fangzhongdai]QOH50769.1 hypothetical protein DYD83_03030 [Dickeya fangzhongdai]GGB97633.1 hypothetical protein GCM10007171_13410 [Dickeya fangzhongdai]